MIVGIDASNIRHGGGVTHLVEVLRAANPEAAGFKQVIVWAGTTTLQRIEDRPWLVKSHLAVLDRSAFFYRALWQRFSLTAAARSARCDVLFVPGGSYAASYRPVVAMSRNLLPFEWSELARFGWSWLAVKLCLLRLAQTGTLRHADGVIFLTRYARDVVTRAIGEIRGKATIIPHGIDARFARSAKPQLSIGQYSEDRPLRLLYVSIVDMYKHQWQVAEAVSQLRKSGIPVVLNLVGPAYPPALRRLNGARARLDPRGEFIRYEGAVPHTELHTRYSEADVCVFASSCENMPNILLEGMASALPIACSRRGPMPEVLGDAGVYFDPEDPADIERALRELIDSPALRAKLAQASFDRARVYSWSRCASETFEFLSKIARGP
ncbi:MAG TPA: glycosyltransferase family 1 protein [Steroidobacteraceae bacterium]|nr:glycosyltransferase family 1 protein [Steroidobacteraceae bacterium]